MVRLARRLTRLAQSRRYGFLLVLLLAVAVRVVHLEQASEHPLFDVPVGAASSFPYVTGKEAAPGNILPSAPLFSWFYTYSVAAAGGDHTPVRVANIALGTAVCLLVYGVAGSLFSSVTGLFAGIGAALWGPLIYFGAELTPTVWITFLLLLLACVLARGQGRGVWSPVAAAVIAVVTVVEAADWQYWQAPDSGLQYMANLYYQLQGREWLPDLDPYRVEASIVAALIWDHGLVFPMGLMLPLAAVGLLRYVRSTPSGERSDGVLLLTALILLVGAAAAADARHRLPLALLLLPFAISVLRPPLWRGTACSALFLTVLLVGNVAIDAPLRLQGRRHHDYWMGVAYERKQLHAHATQAYDRALQKDATHEGSLLARARLALRDGDPDRALMLYEVYLTIDPSATELLYRTGQAFAAAGRFDGAVAVYSKALAAGDSSAALLGGLGQAYSMIGDFDAATKAFAAALRARPDSLGLRVQLARTFELGGLVDSAIEQYRILLADQPDRHDLHARYGQLLIASEERNTETIYMARNKLTKEAEAHLRKAVAVREDYLPAHVHLALLLSKQQRYEEAISQFERVLELAPEEHELHLYLGNLHERAGAADAAQRHYSIYRRLERSAEMQGLVKDQMRGLVQDLFGGTGLPDEFK